MCEVLSWTSQFRSQWSIGNGVSTDLWRQNWLGTHSLKDRLQLSSADIANFKSKVGSLVYNSTLLIPPQLHEVLVEAGLDSNNVLKDEDSEPDTLIWCPMINGKFSVKSAYSEIRETRNEAAWAKFIWKAYIHPRVSAQAWKIIRNGVALDSRAQSIGVSLASICRVCKGGEDSVTHVVWHCPMAQRLWQWARRRFKMTGNCLNFQVAMKGKDSWSLLLKHLWTTIVVNCLVALWQHRDNMVWNNAQQSMGKCCNFVRKQVLLVGRFSKALHFGSPMELDIVETWGINTRVSPGCSVQECYWLPPPHMVMKVNTDGAATGLAGIGFVFKDHDCNTIMVGCQQIGADNCFFAECLAILIAMEVAAARGWTKLWVETDSQAALGAFANFQVPWRLTFKWKKVKSCFTSLLLSSIWKEANFSADKASKIALQKSSQELELIDGKPPWLDRVESPDCAYYRFS
ncbi:hypothetical protein FRX31_008699 [Thalictrum thalictroides]|uniref:Uncharacterized protein n=1 Tax=Thalictrum thalictroides TaxID=46969 RepID=A0A7J6WWA1_THATH|nr:hypothetical protein FRX31_008699 [Thalictrum thalictroides]